LGCVVFVGTSGSAGLVFSLFVCGVVSFVFWGIIAGCSTADMGRDTCSFLVYYPLCYRLCPRTDALSPHCHCFSTVGFLILFIVRFKSSFQFAVRGCLAPYSLLCGVTVICVFTWTVCVEENSD
jgi:hypothetical protein